MNDIDVWRYLTAPVVVDDPDDDDDFDDTVTDYGGSD